jgi:small redox-active disulfide protein 2
MKIEILGTGCPKCNKLESLVKTTVEKLKLDAEINHIYDINEILSYNVMMTPALVVDGVVKISGKLPSEAELEKLLQ